MKKRLGIIALLVLLPLLMARTALADLNEGLVGYWPFSGNANDESGNGHHGVTKGDATFKTGVVGKALYLDGDGDYVDLGNGLNLENEYSVSVWIKTKDTSREYPAILAKYETNHYGPYDFDLHYDKINLWLSDGSGGAVVIDSNSSIEKDEWTYIAYVIKNEQAAIFIDGILDVQGNVPNMTHNNDTVTIGRQALMFSPHNNLEFRGYIDELRVYNRPLSESDILELFGEAPKLFTQEQVDTAKSQGHEAGRQACINDPLSCGISPTQEQLDTAKSQGHEAGRQACINDPLSCGISSVPGGTATFSFADNILRIPTIEVSAPLIGTQVYKADMLLVPSEAPFGFHFEIQMLEQTQ